MAWLFLQTKSHAFDLVPPQPIRKSYYRCDSRYHVDVIKDLWNVYESYLVIDMDGKETRITLVKGEETKLISTVSCHAHGRHKKGGQSQNRYQRQRVHANEEYVTKVLDAVKPYRHVSCWVLIGISDKHAMLMEKVGRPLLVRSEESASVLARSSFEPPKPRVYEKIQEALTQIQLGNEQYVYGMTIPSELCEWIIAPQGTSFEEFHGEHIESDQIYAEWGCVGKKWF